MQIDVPSLWADVGFLGSSAVLERRLLLRCLIIDELARDLFLHSRVQGSWFALRNNVWTRGADAAAAFSYHVPIHQPGERSK
jgi:hypothetical protein